MSYTRIDYPDDLKFSCNPSGQIELTFICPRCEHKNYHIIEPEQLVYGFEIICDHPTCKKQNERYGYELTFFPSWEGSILGLNDRPLHKF